MSDEREQRNQVFTPPTAPTGVPTMSAIDKVKAEFGLDVPIEVVPLPSAGKAYAANHPLHNCESVEIRAMTAREEDILTSKALLKKGTVISELIKSCLSDKNVSPSDLLIGDRNALMVAIRITGYGAEYDAEVQCGECDVKSNQQFQLGELPIRHLDLEPVSPGLNLFEYKLPYSGKTVRFKFMTGRDEEEINATHDKQKKLGLQTDASVTTNLLYSIVSVDGIEDRSKISSFVRMMPARDSLSLRTYVRTNEPGITMRQDVECPACGHSEEVTMPIGVSFLWPAAVR